MFDNLNKMHENIEILKDAYKRLYLSEFDENTLSDIETHFDYLISLFQTYIDFEEGFDPDRDSE